MQSQLDGLRSLPDPFAFAFPDALRIHAPDDDDDDPRLALALDIPKHPAPALGFYSRGYVHSPDDHDALDHFDADLISPASDGFPAALHNQPAHPANGGDTGFGALYNLDDISSFADGRPSSSSSSALSYSPPHSYSYPPVPPFSSSPSSGLYSSGTDHGHDAHLSASSRDLANRTYAFVALPGNAVRKRPRRRYDEIERLYACNWPGCTKAYGTLNHLNAHVNMQKHGDKRHPSEFKELRKHWRRLKKEQQEQESAARQAAAHHHHHQQQHMRRRATDPGLGVSSLFPINPALAAPGAYSGSHRHALGMGMGIGEESYGPASSAASVYHPQSDPMGSTLMYPEDESLMRRASESERQQPHSQIGYGHHHYADLNAYSNNGTLMRVQPSNSMQHPSSQHLQSLPPLSALSDSLAASSMTSGGNLSSLNMNNLPNMSGLGLPSPISPISPVSPADVNMAHNSHNVFSFSPPSLPFSSHQPQAHGLHHSQSHPHLRSQSLAMGQSGSSPRSLHRMPSNNMLLGDMERRD